MSRPGIKHFLGALALMISFIAAVSAQAQSDQYVNPQNTARQAVAIPNLTWDSGLANYATNWANHQATQDKCQLVHSGGPYGENIYWNSGASQPADAVAAWVNEQQYYDHATNSCAANEVCGHYTQVVWKNTQNVGCGSATCSGGGTFVVCSYQTPGNYVGQSPY